MWKIVTQTEKVGRSTRYVLCKNVRFRPEKSDTGINFISIGYPLFQVIVRNEVGTELKIKWQKHRALSKFVIHFSNGQKEDYVTLRSFVPALAKRFGELTMPILEAFKTRIPEVANM